jgi:hypothetical protein
VWAISRGEVPSPSTPSMSGSPLSWPLTWATVPAMFRGSGASAPFSEGSSDQLRWSERHIHRGNMRSIPRTEQPSSRRARRVAACGGRPRPADHNQHSVGQMFTLAIPAGP